MRPEKDITTLTEPAIPIGLGGARSTTHRLDNSVGWQDFSGKAATES
jgi:hypothetical protein